jgi:hypothetical protein
VSDLALPSPDLKTFGALADGFVTGLLASRGPVILTDDYAPVDRLIGIQFTNTKWSRNRGFFGDSGDLGDDPVLNSSSGIGITIGSGGGSTGGAIVGTNNAGYFLQTRFCRSDVPLLPLVPRPDTFRFSQFPNSPVDDGLTGDTTTPNNLCLNEVTIDYTNEFSVGTNTFNITLRLYCFVSGVAPCLIA